MWLIVEKKKKKIKNQSFHTLLLGGSSLKRFTLAQSLLSMGQNVTTIENLNPSSSGYNKKKCNDKVSFEKQFLTLFCENPSEQL